MPLLHSRRPTEGSITITSIVKEIALPNSRDSVSMVQTLDLIWIKYHYLIQETE